VILTTRTKKINFVKKGKRKLKRDLMESKKKKLQLTLKEQRNLIQKQLPQLKVQQLKVEKLKSFQMVNL
jgi:hypothetical protein